MKKNKWVCLNCGSDKVVWDSDADLQDMGIDRRGIVKFFHCLNCGWDIEYYIYEDKEDEDADNI